MALIAHLTQGPFLSHSLRFKSSQEVSGGSSIIQFISKTKAFVPLKHYSYLRERTITLSKRKAFKVTSFKSNTQNEGSGRRNAKSSKPPAQISSMQQGREDVLSQYQDAQKHPLSYSSEEKNNTSARSLAIQELFGKWLIMLSTQSSSHSMDENLGKKAFQYATSKSQHEITRKTVSKMLKSVLVYSLGLDAAITIPLLIFVPWYLTVKVVYGAEVAKELMPLWIIGPLIVALYVKIILGLCSLYLFLFIQAGKLIQNLPTYLLLTYNFVTEGKLRAYLWTLFIKPIVDIKNFDYGAYSKQKFKQLEAWAMENYLDFVESIWPYYCRTIRFLKKANLI